MLAMSVKRLYASSLPHRPAEWMASVYFPATNAFMWQAYWHKLESFTSFLAGPGCVDNSRRKSHSTVPLCLQFLNPTNFTGTICSSPLCSSSPHRPIAILRLIRPSRLLHSSPWYTFQPPARLSSCPTTSIGTQHGVARWCQNKLYTACWDSATHYNRHDELKRTHWWRPSLWGRRQNQPRW